MKLSRGELIFKIFNTIVMIIIMIICIYPLVYVTFASFSDPYKLMAHRGLLVSSLGFTLKGYDLTLKNPNISSGYLNTLIYMTTGTFINLLMTSLGAYVLSRKNVYWKNLMMILIVFTMYFSGGLIPFFLLVQGLGMMNTVWAVVLPNAIGTWYLIVMRTSFQTIPASIEESAKIDGAGHFTILFRIILPLSLPVVAVMALFYGVGHWNAWFNAMLFLRKRNMYPLQIILREILILNTGGNIDISSELNQSEMDMYRILVQYCTIIVATVPILFAYPFLQRYFIKGVMAIKKSTGAKGLLAVSSGGRRSPLTVVTGSRTVGMDSLSVSSLTIDSLVFIMK
jgi:putative aldouronate transport system permease protein